MANQKPGIIPTQPDGTQSAASSGPTVANPEMPNTTSDVVFIQTDSSKVAPTLDETPAIVDKIEEQQQTIRALTRLNTILSKSQKTWQMVSFVSALGLIGTLTTFISFTLKFRNQTYCDEAAAKLISAQNNGSKDTIDPDWLEEIQTRCNDSAAINAVLSSYKTYPSIINSDNPSAQSTSLISPPTSLTPEPATTSTDSKK